MFDVATRSLFCFREQNPSFVLLFKRGFKDRNIAMYIVNKVCWNYCRPQEEHLP